MAIWVNSYALNDTQHRLPTMYACLPYTSLPFTLAAFLINVTDILFSSSIDKRLKWLYMWFCVFNGVLSHDVEFNWRNKFWSSMVWNQTSQWTCRSSDIGRWICGGSCSLHTRLFNDQNLLTGEDLKWFAESKSEVRSQNGHLCRDSYDS